MAAVADNSCPLTYRKREGFEEPDLVAALRKASPDVSRDGLFHLNVAAFERVLGEARLSVVYGLMRAGSSTARPKKTIACRRVRPWA